MRGQATSDERLLFASMADSLNWLVWSKTKDGSRGTHRPNSILERYIKEDKPQEKVVGFESGEEFVAEWKRLGGG